MRDALENGTWYCHAFCKIPKVQLVCTINDETGELEEDLIRFAEQMPSRTTHRQMVIDAKKSNPNQNPYSSAYGKNKKKDKDKDEPS